MKRIALTFVAGAMPILMAAQAMGVVVTTGDTTGMPTWTRPVAGNPPTPPASGVGTAVPFEIFSFSVTDDGAYAFQSTSDLSWDNYSFLYSSSFDSTQPFTNVIVGNDDNPSIGLSGFTTNLIAGTNYIFVETGFGNADVGGWDLDVTGPGSVIVPEPTSFALVGVGLLATMRRRR